MGKHIWRLLRAAERGGKAGEERASVPLIVSGAPCNSRILAAHAALLAAVVGAGGCEAPAPSRPLEVEALGCITVVEAASASANDGPESFAPSSRRGRSPSYSDGALWR